MSVIIIKPIDRGDSFFFNKCPMYASITASYTSMYTANICVNNEAQTYLSATYHIEEREYFDGLFGVDGVFGVNGLFGVDGLSDELVSIFDDFDDDDANEIPLFGECGDRFSSPSEVSGCQEYLARELPRFGLEPRELDTLFGLLGPQGPKTRLNRNLKHVLLLSFAMQLSSALVNSVRSDNSELFAIIFKARLKCNNSLMLHIQIFEKCKIIISAEKLEKILGILEHKDTVENKK